MNRATKCYPFIEAENAGNGNVSRACELLKVSRAAYYTHRATQTGGRSLREQRDAELTGKIVQIHDTSKQTYGSPRVHHELRGSATNSKPRASHAPASGWPG